MTRKKDNADLKINIKTKLLLPGTKIFIKNHISDNKIIGNLIKNLFTEDLLNSIIFPSITYCFFFNK